MKKFTLKAIKIQISAMVIALTFMACENPNSPGVEYMPDMYRSPAIETYVDYNFPDSMTSQLSPEKSIPRDYHPFSYENSTDGYELAGENLSNPLQLTEQTITEGKQLYESFCAHCHGEKGKGNGSITHPIYGAVPSYSSETPNRRGGRSMTQLKEGHIYHTIMYGLNSMGPHSSLIREKDRWKIVAYVQTLQGKDPIKLQAAKSEQAENKPENKEN